MTNKELNRNVAKHLLGWQDFWGEPAWYINDKILLKQIMSRMEVNSIKTSEPEKGYYHVTFTTKDNRSGTGGATSETAAAFRALIHILEQEKHL